MRITDEGKDVMEGITQLVYSMNMLSRQMDTVADEMIALSARDPLLETHGKQLHGAAVMLGEWVLEIQKGDSL